MDGFRQKTDPPQTSLSGELYCRDWHLEATYIDYLHAIGINLRQISWQDELDMTLGLSEEITHAATYISGGAVWRFCAGLGNI